MRFFGLGFFHESIGLGVGLKCQYSVFRFSCDFNELLANSVSLASYIDAASKKSVLR